MELSLFGKQIRKWVKTAPLPIPDSIPQLEKLLGFLGSDESPVRPPALIYSGVECAKKADILFQLHDRLLSADEAKTQIMNGGVPEVTWSASQFQLGLPRAIAWTMLIEDLAETTSVELSTLSWFVASHSRKWVLSRFNQIKNEFSKLWDLNDEHRYAHQQGEVPPVECFEHRRIVLSSCDRIRRGALSCFADMRKELLVKFRNKLRVLKLSASKQEFIGPPAVETSSPVKSAKRRKGTPRNDARDKIFFDLREKKKSFREIAALHNTTHFGEDTVSESAVKKAVARYESRHGSSPHDG